VPQSMSRRRRACRGGPGAGRPGRPAVRPVSRFRDRALAGARLARGEARAALSRPTTPARSSAYRMSVRARFAQAGRRLARLSSRLLAWHEEAGDRWGVRWRPSFSHGRVTHASSFEWGLDGMTSPHWRGSSTPGRRKQVVCVDPVRRVARVAGPAQAVGTARVAAPRGARRCLLLVSHWDNLRRPVMLRNAGSCSAHRAVMERPVHLADDTHARSHPVDARCPGGRPAARVAPPGG
jgi:hypothetical protein